MAVRFSDQQVIKATAAKRLRRGARASYEAVCTDTRALSSDCLFVPLEGENFDGHQFLAQAAAAGAGAALVQRGKVLPQLPENLGLYEVEDTLLALGALARFHRCRFSMPVGAVTGSNGKTTTKEMIASILSTRGPTLKTEGNLNNEIGLPLTLFRLEGTHVAAIVEMGMNHPGEIGRLTEIAQPDAGLVTVVQPAHLLGLGSIDRIAAAKGELFHGLKAGATAVVNLDDPRIVEQARQSSAKTFTFGKADAADVQLQRIETRGREGLLVSLRHEGRVHEIPLKFLGEHNAQNAAGAFALCLALGYHPDECARGLSEATPHSHRLNLVDGTGGVTVVDDCYNANPGSMTAALATLEQLAKGGRAVAVLGDMLELGTEEAREHRALVEKATQVASVVALFGPRLGQAPRAALPGVEVAHFTEVEGLMGWLRPQLTQGDVVLVKGSRGMRLERVVDALTGRASQAGH